MKKYDYIVVGGGSGGKSCRYVWGEGLVDRGK